MSNTESTTKIQKEIYKDIPGYEGYYQVSDLGNVKSLERRVYSGGVGRVRRERILKPALVPVGYLKVVLQLNRIRKNKTIHQLVCMAFLGHKPNGYKLVVNHKNFIRTDNCLENLEIITQRENTDQKHLKSTSKYTGVYWNKGSKKWRSVIEINRKKKHLGYFTNEKEAHLAYQFALARV